MPPLKTFRFQYADIEEIVFEVKAADYTSAVFIKNTSVVEPEKYKLI